MVPGLPGAATRPNRHHAAQKSLRDHPDGLSGSERWIGPLPNL
jgi:hypothetical protein